MTIASEAEQQTAVVRLDEGYWNNAPIPLVQYLEAWREKLAPTSESTLAKKPRVEREAYAVFQAFFRPTEATVDGKYVIIQKELQVTLVDDDLAAVFSERGKILKNDDGVSFPEDRLKTVSVISHLTLNDFRPPVSKEIPKVLYLSRQQLEELLDFIVAEDEDRETPLVDRYWDVVNGTVWGDEDDAVLQDRKDRLQYLNTKLSILPGHFGTGWYFESHPSVGRLYLSRDYRRAVAAYRNGYGGGEAYIQKNDKGNWEVILRDENWVE